MAGDAAFDIATKFIADGFCTAIETDLFLGSKAKIPSKPENVGPYTSLIDTGGRASMNSHSDLYPQPSLQVVVRASSQVVAKAKARAMLESVRNISNVTINGNFYLRIWAVQEVLDMQVDETGMRSRYGFNLNFLQTQ